MANDQIMIRVTPELHEQLRTTAEREERTVAQTVRYAIKQYLADQPKTASD